MIVSLRTSSVTWTEMERPVTTTLPRAIGCDQDVDDLGVAAVEFDDRAAAELQELVQRHAGRAELHCQVHVQVVEPGHLCLAPRETEPVAPLTNHVAETG
jgi:hypothetical protein